MLEGAWLEGPGAILVNGRSANGLGDRGVYAWIRANGIREPLVRGIGLYCELWIWWLAREVGLNSARTEGGQNLPF